MLAKLAAASEQTMKITRLPPISLSGGKCADWRNTVNQDVP